MVNFIINTVFAMPSSIASTQNLKNLIDTINIMHGISEAVKQQAMAFIQQGAEASTKGHNSPYTLLQILVLTNVNNCHTPEIKQLLESAAGEELVKMEGYRAATPLGSLIYYFLEGKCTFEDFKTTAMLLARNKASLQVSYLNHTLLHILVLNNEGGINNDEIRELCKLDKDLINYVQHNTPLAFLIDYSVQKGSGRKRSIHKPCTGETFRDTAELLIELGAHTNRKGCLTGVSLFEQLLFTNQDNQNDEAIKKLIEKDPEVLKQTSIEYLLNHWNKGTINLEAFKASVMFLAKHKAPEELLVIVGESPTTVLHVLVATNEGGINNSEIISLLGLQPTLINHPPQHTALASLIDQTAKELPTKGTSGLPDFKATVELLANAGADLKVTGPQSAYTPLELLLDTNVGGDNEEAIVHLIEKNKGILETRGTEGTALEHVLQTWDDIPQGPDLPSYQESADNNKRSALLLARQGSNYDVRVNGKTLLDRLIASNRDGNNDKSIVELLQLNQDQYLTPLRKSLEKMSEYGNTLSEQGSPKGSTGMQLAKDLSLQLDNLLSGKMSFAQFQVDFPKTLTSKNTEMSVYRINWNTIIANVFIALTGIGILGIAAHLAFTYYGEEQRALFFFQESKTTSETLLDDIKEQATTLHFV